MVPKTRMIESPPKELLVDLDSDSLPAPSAAKVVRPERPRRASSTEVMVGFFSSRNLYSY